MNDRTHNEHQKDFEDWYEEMNGWPTCTNCGYPRDPRYITSSDECCEVCEREVKALDAYLHEVDAANTSIESGQQEGGSGN